MGASGRKSGAEGDDNREFFRTFAESYEKAMVIIAESYERKQWIY